MKKSELRTLYLERRSSLSAEEAAEASRRIAALFFDSIALTGVRRLHTFIPIAKFREVDTMLILERIWREYPTIDTLAPRINFETGEIESIAINRQSELIENRLGIPEPAGDATTDETTIDMVLVPLLCFDKRGHRVGYGRGFYDRFLARCRHDCQKVGLSYFLPEQEIEDVAEHDAALDLCITPERIYYPILTI